MDESNSQDDRSMDGTQSKVTRSRKKGAMTRGDASTGGGTPVKKSTAARKPATSAMPKAAGGSAQRGGLGRGLASLIPTGPSKPTLGHSAADVILGPARHRDEMDAGRRGDGNGRENADNARPEAAESTPRRDGEASATTSEAGAAGGRRRTRTPSSAADREDAATARGTDGTPGTGRGTDAVTGAGRGATPTRADATSGRSRQATTGGEAQTTGNDFGATYRELPLDSIQANAKQPREVFDEDALRELVHSIKEFGLLQPIVVRPLPSPTGGEGDERFELIMGERRLRASREAGLTTIPAIVRETQDEDMLRDALLENIHRVQLNPLEEAAAYQQLLEEFGVTQAQLADRLGRSRPLITNMIRLLQLPVSVQRRVGAGVLSAGHARALLGVKVGAEAQERLAGRIVAEGLSVRATEEAVTLLNRGDEKKVGKKQSSIEPPERFTSWATDVSDVLDTKVSVQMGKRKGKIVVEFGDADDFERITELLRFRSED